MKKLSMKLVFALTLGLFAASAFAGSTAFAAEEKKDDKAEGSKAGEKKADKKDKKEKKEGAEAPKGGW